MSILGQINLLLFFLSVILDNVKQQCITIIYVNMEKNKELRIHSQYEKC